MKLRLIRKEKSMKEYRVVVKDRVFRICKSKEEAVDLAHVLFQCGYNDVWVAHKNWNQVAGTPRFVREVEA